MRIIILADLGPKERHWFIVDGEFIITRTVRLLQENGAKDIYITSHLPEYDIPLTTRYEPTPTISGVDAFLATRELWEDETIIVFGDVYFSEAAIKTIVETKVKDYGFFGRAWGNRVKKYGEMFAIKIVNHQLFADSCAYLSACLKEGTVQRGASWELYRYLMHFPLYNQKVGENFYEINDETDDFDNEANHKDWLKVYRTKI